MLTKSYNYSEKQYTVNVDFIEKHKFYDNGDIPLQCGSCGKQNTARFEISHELNLNCL